MLVITIPSVLKQSNCPKAHSKLVAELGAQAFDHDCSAVYRNGSCKIPSLFSGYLHKTTPYTNIVHWLLGKSCVQG